MITFIVTFGYVGFLKPAAGTWGSLAGLVLAYPILLLGGWAALAIFSVLAFGLGLWATEQYTKGSDDHDPSEVVIDEVVGQWIALLPVAIGAAHTGAALSALWPGWVTAFLAFRLFDIWKPLWIGAADARGDAMGVMLDDVIAGVFAALTVIAFAALAHGL